MAKTFLSTILSRNFYEKAKFILLDEAEPQFTKVIRTRVMGEARRIIQDQDFNSVEQLSTKYLKQIYLKKYQKYISITRGIRPHLSKE